MATDQVSDLATLNPGVGEKADLTTMTVAATPINVLYRTAVEAASVEVNDQGKTYDNDEATPSEYLVTLPAGLDAPSDWQATGVADQYKVAANSGDLDLSAIVQTAGANPVTLSDAGLRKLSAANGDDLISRDAVKVGTLQITAVVTADYTFPDGVDTTDLATEQTHDIQVKDDSFTFGTADTDFVVPTFKGYTASVTDASGATQTLTDGQQLSFTSDGTNQTYKVTYTKDAPTITSYTITKTVHYTDGVGNKLADDYVATATVEKIVDAVTGDATTPEVEIGGQDWIPIKGYHPVMYLAQAVSPQEVKYGDDTTLDYTVVYLKNPTTTDTVTKTVEYVDEAGKQLAPTYTTSAEFEQSTDPLSGDVTVDPASATLGHQANPTIKGYHIVTDPAEATTDQTVQLGDDDQTYQVVYEKDAPTITTDTVKKTVHYVDEAGNVLAKDFTDEATFTQSTDAVTDENTYTPETATLGYQADPTIKGYHIVSSPEAATTSQTVKYGDNDGEYTVIYAKDAPTIATDTVTKTVHYVDQDGNPIASDYTDTANFTQSTDAVTGAQTYTPESATLGHQANPTIAGYHVVESPAAATSDQTVEFGYADENYTVVYNKNTPAFGMDTVTKTVHYVDQDGNTIAPDYTTHANFTEVTDPVTGAKTYGPTTATLGYQADPTIKGYHVVTSPAAATTAQTVQYGDADVEITVVYNKNTPAFGMDTVTKTVHYVDQNGQTIAPDYTTHANFTEIIDPVTGAKSYGPESATLGYQADPTITGYHIVTSPAGATSAQTVQYGDADASYTVVYAKDVVADNGGTGTTGNHTTTPRGTLPNTSVGEPSGTTTSTTSNTVSHTSLPATDAQASTHGQLPQTGDQHESLLAILGVSLLSLLGIAGFRRKRDE